VIFTLNLNEINYHLYLSAFLLSKETKLLILFTVFLYDGRRFIELSILCSWARFC